MSLILHVIWPIFVIILLAYNLVRLGAVLKIPPFVKWSSHFAAKPPVPKLRGLIGFDADTIALTDLCEPKGKPLKLKWSEITRVTAFKRDLFAVDLICLCLEFTGDLVIEFDEEMVGWKAFIEALPDHLAGCKADWFSAVAFPAFTANPTEIYRRQTSQTT